MAKLKTNQLQIIENILIRFNFNIVYFVVKNFGGWNGSNPDGVPTHAELEETARERLESAFEYFNNQKRRKKENPEGISASGGFEAHAYEYVNGQQEATLKFILEETVDGDYE